MYCVCRMLPDGKTVQVTQRTNNYNHTYDQIKKFRKDYPDNMYVIQEQNMNQHEDWERVKLRRKPGEESKP